MAGNERHIQEEKLGYLDVLADNTEQVIVADPIYKQALSFLFGWIDVKKAWKPILSDTDGRLLVSSAPTKGDTGVHSNPAMSTTSATVLTANPDRKAYVIQNTSAVDLYLSFDGGAATTSDFKIASGQSWVDDVFVGAITGILSSGSSNINVLEIT